MLADGSFIPAKQGDSKAARPSGARGPSGWLWSMAREPPLGAYLEAATPAEVRRLEKTLATVAVGRPGKPGRPCKRPARLIADRGYDRNPLRMRLARRSIEALIPARSTHKRATHQDGRKLRKAYSLYLRQPAHEKARLLKIVQSNCTWDGVSPRPEYRKPFDILAEGLSSANWLPGPDSNQRPSG